jgi:hypothetical protein
VHCHILRALNRTNEWITAFGVIFKFDLNATSSWQKTWTLKGAHSS